jgi:hypothetical protein
MAAPPTDLTDVRKDAGIDGYEPAFLDVDDCPDALLRTG